MSLSKIQSLLKAPKGQFNDFGKYKYRSCEDILEAAKPVLAEFSMSVTLTDEIICVSDRVYVKATATLFHDDGKLAAQTTAYARESLTKRGMDEAQITGSASSYARKYALNGLLAIDDTKDADTQNNSDAGGYTPKYTPQHKEVFDYLIENNDDLGLYCFIQVAGQEIYTDLFNSGEKGSKVALKNTCRDLEKTGKAIFDNIQEALETNDSFLAAESLSALTAKGKSLFKRHIGQEKYSEIIELSITNESA